MGTDPWGSESGSRPAGPSQGVLASTQLVAVTVAATALALLVAAWRFERAEL